MRDEDAGLPSFLVLQLTAYSSASCSLARANCRCKLTKRGRKEERGERKVDQKKEEMG